jgi:hypothetical protein
MNYHKGSCFQGTYSENVPNRMGTFINKDKTEETYLYENGKVKE